MDPNQFQDCLRSIYQVTREAIENTQDLDPVQHSLLESILRISGAPDQSGKPVREIKPSIQSEVQPERLWQDALIEAIFEVDPSGLAIVTGENLQVVFANPAFQYICLHDQGSVTGLPLSSVWPGQSLDLYPRIEKVISDGKPTIMPGVEHTFPDGAVRYFTFQARRINWIGRPAALIVLWDTTEQQVISLQAQHERDRLHAVLQSMADEVWICDTRGQIIETNTVALENIGYENTSELPITVSEIANSLEILHLDGTPIENDQLPLMRSLKGESVQTEEVIHNRLTGEVHYRTVRSNPIKNEDGTILGAVGIARDNTQERLATQQLLYHSMLLDNLHDAVIAMDANRNITAWNKSAEQLSGVSARQAIGKPFYELVNRENASLDQREADRRRIDESGKLWTEYAFLSKEGKRVILESVNIVLHDPEGHPAGYMVASRNITERKQIEAEREQLLVEQKKITQALQESEARYRSIFTSMTEGFALHEIVCDRNGTPVDYRFLDVNPAFERLTGLKREDVVGKLKNDVLPGDDPAWIRIYGEVALTGKPIHFENFSPALKQTYDVFAYCPAPMQFAVLFLNITERKQKDEMQRINLAKYQALFNSLPLGITISDDQGNILETNEEASRLLGIPATEHTSRTIADRTWSIIRLDGSLMPADEYASVRALKEKHRVDNVEMGIVKEDNQVTWITVTAAPIPLEGYGVLVAYHDITEQKHAEQARKRSEQQLKETLESIQDGFMQVDRNWCFTYINPRAAQNVGWEPQALLGENIWETFPIILGTDHERYYRQVMADRQPARFEVSGVLSDRQYEIRVYPAQEGISIFWIDVTERMHSEEESRAQTVLIELQHRLLEQREQERLQISRDLHDGPVQELTGAFYAVRGLQNHLNDEDLKQEVVAIGNMLKSQISELRAFSQELRPPALSRFGLERAIRSHIDSFKEKCPSLLLELTIDPGSQKLPQDISLALYRILQEALNNIAKHARAQSANIHLGINADQVVLEIQDDGVGFNPPKDWLDMARKGHLGLVGIRERAEAAGGKLGVTSQVGTGTTIRVVVPLPEPEG